MKVKQVKQIFPDMVFVAFESPHRMMKTLQIFDQIHPKMQICAARELTKKFEEVIRGSSHELLQHTYKGEITIVFS